MIVLPPLIFCGGAVRKSFYIISTTVRMYLEILGMSRVQKNNDNSKIFAVIDAHCGGLLLKMHPIKMLWFSFVLKNPNK